MDIRVQAKINDIPLWKIAAAMSISEQTLIRHMRVKFDKEKAESVMKIIDDIKKGKYDNYQSGI